MSIRSRVNDYRIKKLKRKIADLEWQYPDWRTNHTQNRQVAGTIARYGHELAKLNDQGHN